MDSSKGDAPNLRQRLNQGVKFDAESNTGHGQGEAGVKLSKPRSEEGLPQGASD